MSDFIQTIIIDTIKRLVEQYTASNPFPEEWDLEGLQNDLNTRLTFKGRVDFGVYTKEEIQQLTQEDLIEMIIEEGMKIYQEREEEIEAKQLRYTERLILMKNIDIKWMEHLDVVEQIRQGIGFQSVGRQDPVRVFNAEAFNLFDNMLDEIKEETIKLVFALRKKQEIEEKINENVMSETERKERIEILEEKYKVNRKHLSKVPANLPKLSFNMDINAIDYVDVEIALYYFENGVEERLKSYDKKMSVRGVFQVLFDKPQDKDWNMGWYAVKAFVLGQEAANIHFIIIEPVDFKELGRRQAVRNIGSHIKFFSNRNPMISFKLDLKESGKDQIGVGIVYNGNRENVITFEVPVEEEKATIHLDRPENGWQNGFYELLLLEGAKSLSIPFMIVDEYEREADQLNIPINLRIQDNREIDFQAQLVYIETKQNVVNIPLKVRNLGAVNLGIKRQSENWKIGRYEFRLLDSDRIVLTKHFLVS